MAIGNDDFYDDLDDDLIDNTPIESDQQDDSSSNLHDEPVIESTEEPTEESNNLPNLTDEFISALLKSRRIEDPSKIKFDDGEELNWNDLDVDTKLNIINTSFNQPERDLDDSEIQLINAIRNSLLSPQEYIQYIQKSSVDTYIQNMEMQNSVYSIDQFSDEELFTMDLLTKSGDITEDEALEALERAKSNDVLFKKLMAALRNTYKLEEEERARMAKFRLELEAQQQFNLFAEQIETAILNFNSFSGGDLEMTEDDMNDLYTFIVGTDNAGNNWFNKALKDPNMVVLMAWFVLNGEKMISDINDYYLKEITKVRQESYNKGVAEARDKSVVYKPKNNNTINHTDYTDDLDDEF